MTTTPYHDILAEAAEVYQERQATGRKDVWKNSGARGQAFGCFAKAERMFVAAMRGDLETVEREGMDLINYANFAVQAARDGDLNGSWPWEPDD